MLAPGRQRPICIEAIHALLEPHGNPCNGRRWLYRQPYGLWTGRCRRERVVVLDNLSTGFDWAVAKGVPLIVGDTGDQTLVAQIIREHNVNSIIHFAAWLVVPDSVRDPLGYYKNNTVN